MMLELEDAQRFYHVFWPLLTYVNQQKGGLIADWPEDIVRDGLSLDKALPVRDALWQDNDLLDRFVADNPADLDAADLALALSWKNRVSGSFCCPASSQETRDLFG